MLTQSFYQSNMSPARLARAQIQSCPKTTVCTLCSVNLVVPLALYPLSRLVSRPKPRKIDEHFEHNCFHVAFEYIFPPCKCIKVKSVYAYCLQVMFGYPELIGSLTFGIVQICFHCAWHGILGLMCDAYHYAEEIKTQLHAFLQLHHV